MSNLNLKKVLLGEDPSLLYFRKNPSATSLEKLLNPGEVTGGGGSLVLNNSPALTGEPTAPTPTAADNSTKIATTAFAVGEGIQSVNTLLIPVGDETTALTTGANKFTFRFPTTGTIQSVRASVTTAPTSTAIQVDINTSGTSIFSTPLTIDSGEKTSTTAATAAVLSKTSFMEGEELTVDIDAVGDTVAGAGLKILLTYTEDSVIYDETPGQIEYTSAGTFDFTVPNGITSVCVVCVGGGGNGGGNGGGSGGGGALAWRNSIAVTPGTTYTNAVVVGGPAVASTFTIGGLTVSGGGGTSGSGSTGGSGGSWNAGYGVNTAGADGGGGQGGNGSNALSGENSAGGGGAGGYTGNGGNGGSSGTNGSGGGGGGGGGNGDPSYGGGGVGIYGSGASGVAGAPPTGGSGGASGTTAGGGAYGGGADGYSGTGASGAVRIIWGTGRAYPGTNSWS